MAQPMHGHRAMFDADEVFDRQLPFALSLKAHLHFTPIAVARHAAELAAPARGRVLDIGSGAGKFCITAAKRRPDAHFVGVERRLRLVELARRLAGELANVEFIHADALDLDWSSFDAFYFYNPFGEHLHERPSWIDETVMLDPAHYPVYVDATIRRLARARAGTRVVTYHGLGEPLPATYELVRSDVIDAEPVELWVKTLP